MMRTRALPALACLSLVLTTAACSGSGSEPEATSSSTTTSSTSAHDTGFEPSPISWSKCKGGDFKGLKCASLEVPLDYADPTGAQISLALSMLPHKGEKSRGVLLSNPGGPGMPGRALPVTLGESAKVLRSYDIIGIDTRGIGGSTPAIDCGKPDGGAPTKPPTEDAAFAQWEKAAADYARRCADGPSKALLPHVSTANLAEDMDSVRKALGADKINYWGMSFGTHLGQTYATLHPDRVEKMLLDGVTAPDLNWSTMGWQQVVTLNDNLARFYAYLAQNDKVLKLGSDPAAIATKVKALFRKLQQKPTGDLGPDQLSGALNQAAYGTGFWTLVGPGLSAAINDGDFRVLAGLASPSDGAEAGYLAVTCNESQWPDFADYVEEAKAAAVKAPYFAWGEAWLTAPCVTWPGDPVEKVTIDGSAFTAPVLLYGETYDGATPFSGALATRAAFPSAALIEGKDGVNHAASAGTTGCAKKAISTFWADGTLPERKTGDQADLICPVAAPAKPMPMPTQK
ncbi:MAG: alpha/beta fold hydrolase [Nocardioides sp.]|jgi:pimeloyl-ACP methyl ester carboxylesterase